MSEDINVTDGTVLECLNNKVDLDGGNYVGSPLETYIHEHCAGSGIDGKITNCITEIPQRIKYELVDGTLTIKAGSVVIVPYGVEDLTATYPVGSTFVNDNFKVYDTCYTDGKFFVWAELVGDTVNVTSTATDTNIRPVVAELTGNGLNILLNSYSGTGYTNTTNTTSLFYYDVTTNEMQRFNPNGVKVDGVRSLPIMRVQADATVIGGSVTQVFNGMGYIGSTVWVDKGVKGLVPDGRNADGTLKNIEARTESVLTFTTANGGDRYFSFKTPINGVWTGIDYKTDLGVSIGTQNSSWYYSEVDNYWLYNGSRLDWIDFAHATLNENSPFNITSFVPKTAINLSNVVHATGDEEIRGVKRFVHNSWGQVIIKGSDIDITTTPSSSKYIGMDFRDNRENRLGFIGIHQNTGNDRIMVFQHQNSSKFYFDGAVMIRQKFGTEISIASGYTATASGIIYAKGYSNSQGASAVIRIDGLGVYNNAQSGGSANHHEIAVAIPIYQGQTVTFEGSFDFTRFRPYVSLS